MSKSKFLARGGAAKSFYKPLKTSDLSKGAVIAALYVVASFVFQEFASGLVQVRLSEALTVFACLTPAAIPGLFIGCLLTNIITGGGIIDIIFGSLATLLAGFMSYKLRKHTWLVPLPPVIINAVVVGTYLWWIFEPPYSVWWQIAYIGVGQFIACYVIGLPLLFMSRKFLAFYDESD